jgi:transcription-repair coupling factor (superfamily II helicase)
MTPLQDGKGSFTIDDTIGVALVVSAFFAKKHENCIVFASNMYNAQRIFDIVSGFVKDDEVLLFPNDELLRSETLTSSKEFLSQRLCVLNSLLDTKPKIIIAYPASLMRYLPPIEEFRSRSMRIQVGLHYNLRLLKEFLFASGYSRVSKIDQSLQYASRGNILDIFSVNYNRPIRINFNDDEVESIKYFDIASQNSQDSVDSVEIIPATDTLYNKDEIERLRESAIKQIQKDREIIGPAVAVEIYNNFERDYELLKSGEYSPSLYRFYSYAKNELNSILDYVKPSVIVVANKKQFEESAHLLYEEANQYLNELFEQGRIMSHLSVFRNVDSILGNRRNIVYGISSFYGTSSNDFTVLPIVCSGSSFSQIEPTIKSYIAHSKKIIISLSNIQQYDAISQILNELKIEYSKLAELSLPAKQIGLLLRAMKEGFELPESSVTVLTSAELFGQQYHNSRLSGRFKEATILKSYDELNPGDFIVHEFHGIGQYIDIKTIEVDGIHRDFLHIAYAGSDVLYVPLSQFRLVRKYAGREGAAPKLNHLNSGEWEKRKSKIKKRVNELAEHLLALYKERIAISGYAFPTDDEIQKMFENSFEYELTDDQKKAIEEIKHDMEQPHPMDRLLCGDVGFGKTEVAFTAAFKAINSGKQVAILCPTTLLARQHYEVARKRFDQFGIRIAIFSRLIPNHVQKNYMEQIAKGEIDLIIGTHRLLSKEIKYKELGLLIVDEEQRFGVEQKERIKTKKTNVDVLTLSATPIPRTLQMSLIGLRQFSQINTAPENRNPIQTYVIAHKDDVIKELIERELARNGQVFYVYNKVSSIRMIASRLQSEIKGAKIGVVHGQMQRDDIEDVMMQFYSGELNILVCTSIIENGIDIQNANMIIVEDADTFGLAQLYQIKGRVGRGDRIAYAYLLYRPYKELNDKATKRLKAIQEFTELGSGYKIAQRDLMIRGAGDILGPEQAGYIDSIGIDLYLKLLNEAITGKSEEIKKPVTLFNIDAYIPQEYADKPDKIEIYQEIENVKSSTELELIKKRIRDIYGKIPSEVLLLIKKRKIDLLLENPAFEKIDEGHEYIDVSMSIAFSTINGIGSKMFDLLISHLDSIKVTYVNRILKIRLKKKEGWIEELDEVLRIIIKLFEGSVK